MPEPVCRNCWSPAEHEADLNDGDWEPYCCICFDHDWPAQRLVEGQECQKERVEVTKTTTVYEWRWKEPAVREETGR